MPPDAVLVAREALAVIALSHVGEGDELRRRVWLDVLRPPQSEPVDAKGRPLSWCRAFVLFCVRECRTAAGLDIPESFIWTRGFEVPLDLPLRRLPHVGAEAYRRRGQHGAIVTRVPGDGTVETVDGNSTGGRVVHHVKPINDWDAFYDLDPMLTAGSPC